MLWGIAQDIFREKYLLSVKTPVFSTPLTLEEPELQLEALAQGNCSCALGTAKGSFALRATAQGFIRATNQFYHKSQEIGNKFSSAKSV